MPNKTDILELLKALLPVQFNEVISCFGVPKSYLTVNGPQATQALELLQYAEQQKDGLTTLATCIEKVQETAPPPVAESSAEPMTAALKSWQWIYIGSGIITGLSVLIVLYFYINSCPLVSFRPISPISNEEYIRAEVFELSNIFKTEYETDYMPIKKLICQLVNVLRSENFIEANKLLSEAIKELTRLEVQSSRHLNLVLARIHSLKGNLDFKLLGYTEAFQHFKEAIHLVPPISEKEYELPLADYQAQAGWSAFKLGRYETATEWLYKARILRKKYLDSSDPAFNAVYNQLAEAYREAANYFEADKVYREQLIALDLALDGASKDAERILQLQRAEVLNNQGQLFADYMGEYVKANNNYEKSYKIRYDLLGPWALKTAESLHNLGALRYLQGRYNEAHSLFKNSLEIKRKILDGNNPSIAFTLHNIALLYLDQKRYADAIHVYNEAKEIKKAVIGKQHRSFAKTYTQLGAAYQAQKDYEKAESLYKQALQVQEDNLAKNHPDIAHTLNSLGGLYYEKKQYDEAKTYISRALNIMHTTKGTGHPDSLTIQRNLTYTIHALAEQANEANEYTKALEYCKQALPYATPEFASQIMQTYTTAKNSIAAASTSKAAASPGTAKPRPTSQAPEKSTMAEQWRYLTVRFRVHFADSTPENGFGFIIGEKGGEFYILTASHVLYMPNGVPASPGQVDVFFYHDPGKPYTAEKLEISRADLDATLLRIEKPNDFIWMPGVFCTRYERNQHAWFIGRQQDGWFIPPDGHLPVLEHDAGHAVNNRILVTTSLVLPGTSGAPLVTDDGLIGMIIQDSGDASQATAVEIGALRNFLRNDAPLYPWELQKCPRGDS